MSVNTYLKSTPLVFASVILGLAIIICAAIAGYTAYEIKASADVIEVTGSAKIPVKADFARWTLTLETRTGMNDQQTGYTRLDGAGDKILSYLREQGLETFETPAPMTMPVFVYPQNAEPYQTGYTVTKMIIVSSDDIEKLAGLAQNIEPLVGQDYNVTSNGLELTYRNLPETRVSLLSDAIKDAEARAESIAKESGREVGALRSATGGVVQVLPEGGVEVSDYGSYDTQSVNKEVMVTVRATFSLD
ncbi:MAG TPA: SIMPL domain-containing protein [Candidatus Paceibacterota bacterium]